MLKKRINLALCAGPHLTLASTTSQSVVPIPVMSPHSSRFASLETSWIESIQNQTTPTLEDVMDGSKPIRFGQEIMDSYSKPY